MRYGAIDIGSNTIQMLTVQGKGGRQTDKRNWLRTTRLGEGQGSLSPESIRESAAVVAEFMEILRREQVRRVRILATSAVRDADNSKDLLRAIALAVPDAPPVEILSGEQEAATAYQGALASLPQSGPWPVVDQGGSSTELVYDMPEGLVCTSGNIGAVRAHRSGWTRQEIRDRVRNTYRKLRDAEKLVGVGGTITTAAGIIAGLTEYQRERIEGREIGHRELEQLLDDLLPLSIPQRCAFSPLLAKRGEIMVEGLEIWLALWDLLEPKTLLVCGGGILDGAIQQMMNNE